MVYIDLVVHSSSEQSGSKGLLHSSVLKSLSRQSSSPITMILLDERTFIIPQADETAPKTDIRIPKDLLSANNIEEGQSVRINCIDLNQLSPVTFATIDISKFTGEKDVWTQKELLDFFRMYYREKFISSNNPITLISKQATLNMTVKMLKTENRPDWDIFGSFTANTQIEFKNASLRPLRIIRNDEVAVLKGELSFEKLGIGGMQSQETTFRRRVIGSRMIPISVLNELGVKHVRGILLHGPPGTGKTLIARQLAAALNSREPKIVNGPEILSKFVGEGEKKLRELFQEAEEEQHLHGDYSMLHVLIFDEIDALCKTRGSTGSSAGDNIVNQFLSKLDGINSLNNLLVIGMTNRIDLIDPAVLRPGRLELHIEVGLPDEAGRVQILEIHTLASRESNRLADDVNLAEIAHRSQNFTGAECKALVNAAIAFALEREAKQATISSRKRALLQVTSSDFENAANDIVPAHGQDQMIHAYDSLITNESREIERKLEEAVRKFGAGSPLKQWNVLITGRKGTGKTSLALYLAKRIDFPCVKVITPSHLLGLTEPGKVDYIIQTFEEAAKSTRSVVVLDEIESLIEYVSWSSNFNLSVLQALKIKLSDCVPNTRKMVVIATSTNSLPLSQLGLSNKFDTVEELHLRFISSESCETAELIDQPQSKPEHTSDITTSDY